MRTLAANGAVPCDTSAGKDIPSDLVGANCIPPGFMVEKGWDIVCNYYQNVESDQWIPYSIQNVDPLVSRESKHEYKYGTKDFKIYPTVSGKTVSPWHDVPVFSNENTKTYNLVVEIPMYSTAKMEMMKDELGNPIMQDVKDNAPRYYSYGTPFFNYGFIPKTWEDPGVIDSTTGAGGDGDPIDVIEVGSGPLSMASIVPVKVLGSFALIDEGEIDHKIIAIRVDDSKLSHVNSMAELETAKPGITGQIVDWLKNYKTSDGKPVNKLKQEHPLSQSEAYQLIEEVSSYYNKLVTGVTPNTKGYELPRI
jgi:3'-phosphoadenosine 5'-phosphosulfate synthase